MRRNVLCTCLIYFVDAFAILEIIFLQFVPIIFFTLFVRHYYLLRQQSKALIFCLSPAIEIHKQCCTPLKSAYCPRQTLLNFPIGSNFVAPPVISKDNNKSMWMMLITFVFLTFVWYGPIIYLLIKQERGSDINERNKENAREETELDLLLPARESAFYIEDDTDSNLNIYNMYDIPCMVNSLTVSNILKNSSSDASNCSNEFGYWISNEDDLYDDNLSEKEKLIKSGK